MVKLNMVKIKLKDYPSESPGTWDDSTLYVKLKGDKNLIHHIYQGIIRSIDEYDIDKNYR